MRILKFNREVDSQRSSVSSQDSRGPVVYSGDTIKRKPSMLVRRMLHINSSSSQGTECSEDSIQRPSVSLRNVSVTVDESDHKIVGNICQLIENAEEDDVFPLDHSESATNIRFPKPKSSTIGRELVVSTSVLNLSQLEEKKSVTLRRQLPFERKPLRVAKSTFFHYNDGRVTSERTMGEEIRSRETVRSSERTMSEEIEIIRSRETVKSFQSREIDIKKRRDAMKRRSTRDLEHSACSIRMYSDTVSSAEDTTGWSEVVECTSMSTIWRV